jgi:hypothetical protein
VYCAPLLRRLRRFRRQVRNLRFIELVHVGRQVVLRQRFLKARTHQFAFVGVVDLVAADTGGDPGLGHALGVADRDAFVFEGEIAARRGAGVEMLVPPHVGRHDHGADLPRVVARFFPVGPHQGIAFARQDDDMRAGAVTVALFIGADGELRDMRVHRAFGEVEADMPAAGAAFLGLDQRQVDRVGHKVRHQLEAVGFRLGGEIVRLAVEAALEIVGRVEDEFRVFVDVHRRRHVGDRDEARRFLARCVEMLVPAVERDGEQRAGAPFEGDAFARVVPHAGRAAARQDHDHFLEQHALRRQLLAGVDLADVAVVRGARGIVVEEHAVAFAPRPGLELQRIQVAHIDGGDDVEPLVLHPGGVGGLFFRGEFLRHLVGYDCVLAAVVGHVCTPSSRSGASPMARTVTLIANCFYIRWPRVPRARGFSASDPGYSPALVPGRVGKRLRPFPVNRGCDRVRRRDGGGDDARGRGHALGRGRGNGCGRDYVRDRANGRGCARETHRVRGPAAGRSAGRRRTPAT